MPCSPAQGSAAALAALLALAACGVPANRAGPDGCTQQEAAAGLDGAQCTGVSVNEAQEIIDEQNDDDDD